MLFSLRSTAPNVQTIESAFRRTLEVEFKSPVDFHAEYLDLPSDQAVPYAGRLADFLVAKYAGRRIDVIVVQRHEGLAFLLEHRATLFPGVPLVFADVNSTEFERLHSPPGLTGVLSSAADLRTVSVALDVVPNASQIVIAGGASPFDRQMAAVARRLAEVKSPNLKVLMLDGLPLESQLKRVAELQDRSVIVFTSYRADSAGRSMVAVDMLRALAHAANAPVFGSSESWLGQGIVGGDLIQFGVLGERAAALTARVLNGEPLSSIAPVTESASTLMFDWRELQRWQIDERLLPAGSVVKFRQPPAWFLNRTPLAVFGAVAAGLTLLLFLSVRERRVRKQTKASLAEVEQRYRAAIALHAIWEYWTRPDGSVENMSRACLRITGYEPEAFVDRPALLSEIIVPEDVDQWMAGQRQVREAGVPSTFEFRITTRGGEIKWISQLCSPVADRDGAVTGTYVSNRDITAKKRADDDLQHALAQVVELRSQLEADPVMRPPRQEGAIQGLIGTSNVMRYVTSKVHQVASTDSTVLLQGETGVGKSVVAKAIHDLSPRRSRPFVTLDCAALPPTLVESELFGHEKGAFTGATGRRAGRFETANGGTLFLDEIGDLPLDLQGKLLRAVQDGAFERVGSNVTLRTNVRVIAATNHRLEDAVKAGRFRQDLWYRLHVFPITVPPLRQRTDDIALLVNHFVEKHCRKLGRPVLHVSKATMNVLEGRDWPGNIRELENVVERTVITSLGSRLELSDDAATADGVASDDSRGLAELERHHIVRTLDRLNWRVEGDGGAAESLGINASTLRSRMRKHGIKRPT